MDATARRVKAERDRRRLPQRGATAVWARRIAALFGTAALLGVGAVSLQMVLPDGGGEQGLIEPAPASTPAKAAKKKAPARKPKRKGLTKAQKAARADAVDAVRIKGFTVLKLSDYDPKATLRVLIGRPVGDAAGGYRAFFFERDRFLGNDATGPSSLLRVSRKGKATVTLSYGVYKPGDLAGQPSGRTRVRFRLEGELLHALDPIPFDNVRFQRRR